MMSTETVAIRMGASPEVARALEEACIAFGITTQLQKSHFLGQISVESNGFKTFRESLNYSVQGLLSNFSRGRISILQANKVGRLPDRRADQPAIANIIYGGEWGKKNLGNLNPGDGWKYIGRGLKQLTGLYNYTQYSLAMYGDMRIVDNPEMLERLPDAALSAGWFWASRNLNVPADNNDYVYVTKRVNGGDKGLDRRIAETKKAFALFEKLKK